METLAIAHVLHRAAPGLDSATAVQRLVPNPNDEGVCVTLHIAAPIYARSTSILAGHYLHNFFASSNIAVFSAPAEALKTTRGPGKTEVQPHPT
jgi:hypothetical protein